MEIAICKFNEKEKLKIELAFKHVLKCFKDIDFQNYVVAKTDWTYTDDRSNDILAKIQAYLDSDIVYCIEGYYKRFSKAHGYTFGKEHMYINKKYKKNVKQYAGTLCHEIIHSVGYGHGSNSPKGKDNSVPYFIGRLVRNWEF